MVIQCYNDLAGDQPAHVEGAKVIKRLSKHGNSLALVIDRPILELLGMDEGTPLEISTDGQALVIEPVRDKKRRKRFEEALASTNRRYGKALKRLAE
jgi:antitoxin component of MazEF toxin-antitoxin module